jgi:hypothetical protein
MLTTERLTVLTSSVTTKDVFSCAYEVDVPSSTNQQQHAAITDFLVKSRKTNNISTPQFFIKGPMSSGCVIVARVGAQQMAQMRLAKDDDVVQAFAANGPNQSFGKAVLPWRARSDRFIP